MQRKVSVARSSACVALGVGGTAAWSAAVVSLFVALCVCSAELLVRHGNSPQVRGSFPLQPDALKPAIPHQSVARPPGEQGERPMSLATGAGSQSGSSLLRMSRAGPEPRQSRARSARAASGPACVFQSWVLGTGGALWGPGSPGLPGAFADGGSGWGWVVWGSGVCGGQRQEDGR